ncbi:MAG: YggS family pyridoxal phosphate-dependent enzyme [Actinobacteria bacterium]|uniref:Unannotated protein n=1 Tax=freshwater metagenome TaxID=449393 RepID=A0A6J6PLX3_9ZZZZ|nr:YggS family pyridoxal phosphate-dependent enzyme [Actinomycetota bacterium]
MQSPSEIRARYDAIQHEVGPHVTIVAATKYIAADDMAQLIEAGITTVGENRAQDLEAKHAIYGDAFTWHFIGALQSNKAKLVNARCTLVHSVDTDSTARRLTIPMLIQVNIAAEDTKAGIRPDELPNYLQYDVHGLSTMPPAAATPDESRSHFRALHNLASSHGLKTLSMGTTQDYAAAAQEGATHIRVGSVLFHETPHTR